jgi:hypothetical protein
VAIPCPGFAKSKRGDADLGKLNQRLQDTYPGIVAFCGKEDFHGWFAWNPEDVTDSIGHDYGVYLLGGPNGEDSDAAPI